MADSRFLGFPVPWALPDLCIATGNRMSAAVYKTETDQVCAFAASASN